MIDRGGSTDQRACRNIMRYAALRRDDRCFANLAMPDHANLSREDRPVANFG